MHGPLLILSSTGCFAQVESDCLPKNQKMLRKENFIGGDAADSE